MSRCQYTVGNGWHGKERLPKESGYSERRVPGLPQNMRQTVTGLWRAIIGRRGSSDREYSREVCAHGLFFDCFRGKEI